MKIHWSVLHCGWIFYPDGSVASCVGHLENAGLLSYVDPPNIDTSHCTLSKNTFANYTADLNGKIFKVLGNCQLCGDRYKLSKILIFAQKLAFYHWQ